MRDTIFEKCGYGVLQVVLSANIEKEGLMTHLTAGQQIYWHICEVQIFNMKWFYLRMKRRMKKNEKWLKLLATCPGCTLA